MATSYEITGKIKQIGTVQSFGAKGFKKREFVLTVEDGKYPQDIAIEAQGEKVDIIDVFTIGQEVTATFNLRGREYNGRYFNTIVAWRIVNASNVSAPPTKAQPATGAAATDTFDNESEIPF